MRSDLRSCIMFLAFGWAASEPAWAARAPHEYTVEETEIDAPLRGQAPASKVLQDTVWIADWSFDQGGGGCTSAGWVVYDNHIKNDGNVYWHVSPEFDANPVIVNHAAVLSKHDLCWVSDGYGNDWDQSILLKYSGAAATLTFARVLDLFGGDDFLFVEADSLGLSELRVDLCANPRSAASDYRTVLLTMDGSDMGSTVGPLPLPDFGPGVHEVYLRFTSDGDGSHEDGGAVSALDAGAVIDNIALTGGIAYTEDFEGAGLNPSVGFANTANAAPFCAAPWARVFSHITDNDKCTENTTCAWLGTDPTRPAFNPTMIFGPSQSVIRNWLDDVFVSPWVSLAATPTAVNTILSFRRFPGNTFSQSKIVQGWRVRSKSQIPNTDTPAPGDFVDCISPWGHAAQFNSLSVFVWGTSIFDMAPFVVSGAQAIQVSFRTTDWQLINGDPAPATLNTGPGPYVDRIRIGRRVLTGPVMNVGIDTRTQAQDAFATVQNSIPDGEHFSPDGNNRFGTCAFSEGTETGIGNCCPHLITGDSIQMEGVVDARGAGGIASVRFYGAIVAGPHAGKAPAPYSVAANGFFQVNADSARAWSGAVVANRWVVDLDDTYFRGGDELHYFWLAMDNGGGATSSPAGLAGLPASVAAAEAATGGLREVSYLPALNWSPDYLARIAAHESGDLDPTPAEIAATTQSNCILYYQKLTSSRNAGPLNRTSFMYTLDRLGYGGHYDVYDVQGYGNTNNQLGGRANVGQCSGYALIVQDDGRSNLVPTIPDGTITDFAKINQALWYRNYLAQGSSGLAGQASVWILGENTGFESRTNALVTADLGLSGLVDDQGLSTNPDVNGTGVFNWATGGAASFVGDTFALQGGCPSVRRYDGATAAGTAVVTHKYASGMTQGMGAVVMNANAALKWNTVWMGFPWFDIRDAGPYPATAGTPELALAGKILNGVLPAGCLQGLNPTGVDGGGLQQAVPRVSALHANVPNPFNPVTEIAFDLAQPGRVQLRIFDVSGHLVRTLVDGHRSAGRFKETWNGLNAAGQRTASGVYFYRVDAAGFSATRKMVLMK